MRECRAVASVVDRAAADRPTFGPQDGVDPRRAIATTMLLVNAPDIGDDASVHHCLGAAAAAERGC
jgi:hypothetical protein